VLPDRIRTLADVERLLAASKNYEEKMPGDASPAHFDLARMDGLLADLGRPERGPTTVHVTGSKGKGSTCRILDAILRAAGRGPVGLYVSPHLESLTERVSVDGEPVREAALVRAADALLPALRTRVGTSAYPTFFEVVTAAAHVAFREAGCRTVVLEVGLGGRLDATTVCQPSATAVTTIELEHTKFLGDTLELIAAEKAAIAKPGVPLVTAVPIGTGALAVIEAAVAAVRAPLYRVGREIQVTDVAAGPGPRLTLTVAGPRGAGPVALELPVAGAHQATNAAVAVALARLLDVPDAAIRAGCATVTLPARMEWVHRTPTVVIDGAHTAASARAARATLATCFPHRALHLVVGVLEEKDVEGIVRALVGGATSVVACGVPSPRALAPARLAEVIAAVGGPTVTTAPDPATGLASALARAAPDDLVLVTGSLYLAGAARAAARRLPGFLPRDPAPTAFTTR